MFEGNLDRNTQMKATVLNVDGATAIEMSDDPVNPFCSLLGAFLKHTPDGEISNLAHAASSEERLTTNTGVKEKNP